MFVPVTPVAGPSRSSYTNASFSSPVFRHGSVFSCSSSLIHPSSYSTPTPFQNGNVRIRSASVFSREQWKKEEFSRKRQESREKLKTSWDLLFEKYKNVEDDDEIDLRTGEIVKDRGRLRSIQPRPFGKNVGLVSDDEGSVEDGLDMCEFDSDEDELGGWGNKSGLDPQEPEWELIEPTSRPWTKEDEQDFEEFLKAEENSRVQFSPDEGDEGRNRHGPRESAYSEMGDSQCWRDISPRSRGTRFLSLPTLNGLFSSNQESSEDELGTISNNKEDVVRCAPVHKRLPKALPEIVCPRVKRTQRPSRVMEVVIPSRSRSKSCSASCRPPVKQIQSVPKSASAINLLSDLFTPPPQEPFETPRATAQNASKSVYSNGKGKQRMLGERPREGTIGLASLRLDDAKYFKEVLLKRNGDTFKCDTCQQYGGVRRENAHLCKGRTGMCMFELEEVDVSHISNNIAKDRQLRTFSESPDHSQIKDTLVVNGFRIRKCRSCRDAGGERSENASKCKGKNSEKRCPFIDKQKSTKASAGVYERHTDKPVADDTNSDVEFILSTHTSHSKVTILHQKSQASIHEAETKVSAINSTLRRASNASDSNERHDLVRKGPSVSKSQKNQNPLGKRKSVVVAALPSPPPTSSITPSSPTVDDILSVSPELSLPPSSPPPHDLFSPASRTRSKPIPSPSVSVNDCAAPALHVSRVDPPGRIIHPVYHPTPPPSTDGCRSSSLSSDNPMVSLPRKSALRRPSEFSNPRPPSSVKRIRFSMVPHSPVQSPSPSEGDESEDELDLLGKSKTSSATTPCYKYERSSSPLRNEWNVRAADLGIKLGIEHTGRLPIAMVKNLVPSMGSLRPTLGSSSLSASKFALPSPPLSDVSRQRSLSSIKTTPREASRKPSSSLMLPPPVPYSKIRSTPRLSTPRINTSESPAPCPPPIVFKSLPSPVVHARARSRSASTAPAFETNPSTPQTRSRGLPDPRQLATTPSRKSSRALRNLQRVAKEIGDNAGLEWGLDEEADDGGRMWREGSVAAYR
ncbi:uncharacterized protein L203_101091 [Cryptococcus depauperatus CBS 7841]|uniref:Uncharacterized protein n=1 Tax=Cryptococcus depauperatus CBS 7841 TaxID=1295531 RepID=A0A1E3IKJ3_9TREE|nr:hypothetical protein L203_02445 [Cryptococcus depauperatus CBS 7841]